MSTCEVCGRVRFEAGLDLRETCCSKGSKSYAPLAVECYVLGYEREKAAREAAERTLAPLETPTMYGADQRKIVDACARGDHEWTDDLEDACLHCVLDLKVESEDQVSLWWERAKKCRRYLGTNWRGWSLRCVLPSGHAGLCTAHVCSEWPDNQPTTRIK